MTQYILAHDFGTSGDKASLFTTEGKFVKTKTVGYKTHYSNSSWAEQDPEDWWNAFCSSTTELMEGIDKDKVLCVAFDGTFPNCLCVDKAGKPLYPAMIWQDARSYKECEEIYEKINEEYRASSFIPGKISMDRTLPKLLWVKRNLPEVFKNTYKVFPSIPDYIVMKMTGATVCDYGNGASTFMMTPDRKDWSDYILNLFDIPRSMMPDLKEMTDIVGEIPEKYAAECGLAAGTKLVIGTGDTGCTSIGAGLLKPGDAYMNGGTSAGIIVKPVPGRKRAGGLTASSGSSFSWLKNNICTSEQKLAEETGKDVYDVINGEIKKAPVGSNGVLFHPYLAGERAPRNNPRAKGSFTGISLTSTRQDIMRSVIEGIGLNINVILQDVRDAGYDIKSLLIVGGLGKGDITRQIFADIMNVELRTLKYMDETATVGCAVLGGIALGLYEDTAAVSKFMEISAVTTPNLENHEKYKKLMPLFEKVYEGLKPSYDMYE